LIFIENSFFEALIVLNSIQTISFVSRKRDSLPQHYHNIYKIRWYFSFAIIKNNIL